MNKQFKCTEIERYNFAEFCSAKFDLSWKESFNLLEGKSVYSDFLEEELKLFFLKKDSFGVLVKTWDQDGKEREEKRILQFNNWR